MRFGLMQALSLALAAAFAAPAMSQTVQAPAVTGGHLDIATARNLLAAALPADGWPTEEAIVAAQAAEAAMASWPAELESEFGPRPRVRATLLAKNAGLIINRVQASPEDRQRTIVMLRAALAELGDQYPAQEGLVQFYLGRAYMRMGDRAGALPAYQRAYELHEHVRSAVIRAEIDLSWGAENWHRARSLSDREAVVVIYDQALARLVDETEVYRVRLRNRKSEILAEIANGYLNSAADAAAPGLSTAIARAESALAENPENHLARIYRARASWFRARYAPGPEADAALADMEHVRAGTSPAEPQRRRAWFEASETAIKLLTKSNDDAGWRRAGAISREMLQVWTVQDGAHRLGVVILAHRARPLVNRAEIDAAILEVTQQAGVDDKRLVGAVYVDHASRASRLPQALGADTQLAITYYQAAADALASVEDVSWGTYRLVAANMLLNRAQNQWGADAQGALAIAEHVRASMPIESDRSVWMWARSIAIDALSIGGDAGRLQRAAEISAEVMEAWRAGDNPNSLRTAGYSRVRAAATPAERGVVFARLRAHGVGSVESEAQTLERIALEIYNSVEQRSRALDHAITLLREAMAKAPEAGSRTARSIKLNLANALQFRAGGWDRDAREALSLSEEVRAATALDGDARWYWFEASIIAMHALGEGGLNAEQNEQMLGIAEAVLEVWREGDMPSHLAVAAVTAAVLYPLSRSGGRTDGNDLAASIVDDVLSRPAAAQFSSEEREDLTLLQEHLSKTRRRAPLAGAGMSGAPQVATCAQAIDLIVSRWLPAAQSEQSLPRSERDAVRQAVALCEAGMDDADLNAFGENLMMTYLYFFMFDFDPSVAARGLATAEAALATADEAEMGAAGVEINGFITLFRRQVGGGADAVASAEAALRAAQTSGMEIQVITSATILAVAQSEAQQWAAVEETARIGGEAVTRAIGAGLNQREVLLVQQPARKLFEIAATARVRAGDYAGALAYADRGRAQLLSAALGMSEAALNREDRAELQRLRREIRAREAANERAAQLRRSEVEGLLALRARAATIVASAGRSESYSGRSAAAIVAPIVSDDDASVIVRPARGALTAARLSGFDRATLDAAARAWRSAYEAKNIAGGVAQFRSSMEANLGAAIRTALVEAGVQPGARINLLPDGAMSLLPVALLRDPRTGRTLLEDYEVTFAPSLRALQSAERRAGDVQTRGLVAFWNDTLPFAAAESSFAGGRFEKAAVMSPETVGSSQAAIGALNNAAYWHFAVHAEFNWDNPQASKLQLTSDVSLTLTELLQSGGVLGAPRLIVLSACESGLVDIERDPNEFIGLPAAFLEAGGAGVIASLWPVSDLATSLLFARFYELHRSGARLTAPAALRAAQLWLRDASREELTQYVEDAATKGVLDDAQVDAYSGALNDEGIGDHPFADPVFWGGWIYYGA